MENTNTILKFKSLESTNTYMICNADHLDNLTVVYADRQTSGHGTYGKKWHSESSKGLWFSIIIKDEIFPTEAYKLTILMSVAVLKALWRFNIKTKIKWPNDVLINDKKICGVLSEVAGQLDCLKYQIMGVGLNINQISSDFPEEIVNIATSMKIEAGRTFNKKNVLDEILSQFLDLYTEYRYIGFNGIYTIWKENNCTLGRRINITISKKIVTCTAIDFCDDGSIIVKHDDDSTEKILSSNINFV